MEIPNNTKYPNNDKRQLPYLSETSTSFRWRKFLKTIVIEASDTCTAESLKAWSPGNPKQQKVASNSYAAT